MAMAITMMIDLKRIEFAFELKVRYAASKVLRALRAASGAFVFELGLRRAPKKFRRFPSPAPKRYN